MTGIRSSYRRPSEIIRAKLRAVDLRRPVVRQRQTIVPELEQWLHELCLSFAGGLVQRRP